jgi:hypothetical protein
MLITWPLMENIHLGSSLNRHAGADCNNTVATPHNTLLQRFRVIHQQTGSHSVMPRAGADALDTPAAGRTWEFINARIPELFNPALATSTQKQYGAKASYWLSFCALWGWSPNQPTETRAVQFAVWLSQSQKYQSIRHTMTGVKHFWQEHGCAFDFSSWSVYNQVLKGLRRGNNSSPMRKHPISPDELTLMFKLFEDTAFAAALKACILIAFFGMLRKSNVTADNTNPSANTHCITRGDVEVLHSKYALRVRVRSSKTNQYKERTVEVLLHGRKGHTLDPVGAWECHVASSLLPPTANAFDFIEAGTHYPMKYDTLRLVIKVLFSAIGGDSSQVSSHSLRRGGATFAWHSGVRDILLQAHGDWKSMCYRYYIDASMDARLGATKLMFDRIIAGTPTTMHPALAPLDHVVPISDQMPLPVTGPHIAVPAPGNAVYVSASEVAPMEEVVDVLSEVVVHDFCA